MKIKKILLTGGSGFIGRNILESTLAEKYEILAPNHAELDCTNEDSVDRYFHQHRLDYVIHAATKPGHRNAKDPTNLFYTNTRMFFNLARHTDEYERMFVIGSGAIYDMRYYHALMKEDEWKLHIPIDEHGFSKYVCESYIEKSKNIVDLRVFGIFGKYEDYAIRFISNMICKALFDLPLTIRQERHFSYLFVNDLIPVLDRFMEIVPKYHAYNIVPDEISGLYNLAQKVLTIMGKTLPILVDKPGMGLPYTGDNTRLRTEITNIHFTSIDESVEDLFNWYVKIKTEINPSFLLEDK